jgi:hypothetical protein
MSTAAQTRSRLTNEMFFRSRIAEMLHARGRVIVIQRSVLGYVTVRSAHGGAVNVRSFSVGSGQKQAEDAVGAEIVIGAGDLWSVTCVDSDELPLLVEALNVMLDTARQPPPQPQ